MPTTSRFALPYPSVTDPVSAYPAQAQTLAQTVDTYMLRAAAGLASLVASGSGVASVAVTFPVGRFSSAPRVVCNAQAAVTQEQAVSVSGVSASGFTINLFRASSGTTAVHWIAIEG